MNKKIWELSREEIEELGDTPRREINDTLAADLSTYFFIIEERDKETAERWREWQGQLHGGLEVGKEEPNDQGGKEE